MKKLTLSLLSLFLIIQSSLFSQEQTLPPDGANSIWQTVFMVAIAVSFFYLILLRPEQQRRKALENLRQSLKVGDKVTAIGIVGTIDKIQENTFILKMVDGSKIEVLKGAVTETFSDAVAEDEASKSE